MKLRFKGNTVRLRLDQNDLTRFAEEGRVETATWFGGDAAFRYILQASSEAKRLSAQSKPRQIVVRVPTGLAEEWTQTNRIGLEGEQSVRKGQRLRILVEKDLGCQHRGSEEKDTFDHLRRSEQEAQLAG